MILIYYERVLSYRFKTICQTYFENNHSFFASDHYGGEGEILQGAGVRSQKPEARMFTKLVVIAVFLDFEEKVRET